MDIKLASTSLAETKAPFVALPVVEEDFKKPLPELAALDQALGGVLLEAAKAEGFAGKANETFVLHTHGKIPADRVMLLGLGGLEKHTLDTLRHAAGTAAKAAAKARATKLAFGLPGHGETPPIVRAIAEGLGLGAYRYDKWKSDEETKKRPELKQAIIAAPDAKGREVNDALKFGVEVAAAVNWARDVVNEPAMTMTPEALAEAAREACKAAGCEVRVHDRRKIEAQKMGMFLGVARGADTEPKLIEIRYTPASQRGQKAAPLALIGKAITFDSGGLSLKPADAMVDMKTDMAGSAAVFGAMQVIAKVVKPSFPVHAFVGACENMPSGRSYKPGDVLVARNGKTVEITNTDAEGRLVLGDVLNYATDEKPRAMVDLATLTGACVVALGNYTVGAFGPDDAFMEDVLASAQEAGEDFWRMPMTPEVKENLKSDVADMKNSGARWGGAISAAHFLKEFVGETPWVHLDIAGPASSEKDKGYTPKGGTGVGVRTLVELVRRLDEQK
jgi:leucyl aminopeptidase